MPTPTIFGPDVWGAIQLPVLSQEGQAAPPALRSTGPVSANDPCLWYIGSFLRAFAADDQNITAQWTIAGVAPIDPPIRTVIIGNPNDAGNNFRDDDLPALFIWRGTLDTSYLGDSIGRADSVVKMLWVFPGGTPEQHRVRAPYINALVKGLFIGIERGRTPSWIIVGESEPYALGAPLWEPSTEYTENFSQIVPPNGFLYTCISSGETGASPPTFPQTTGATVTDGGVTWQCAGPWAPLGSSLYKYAAFAQFWLEKSKPVDVRVTNIAGKTISKHPAIEMTCSLFEDLQFGNTNRLALDVLTGFEVTVSPSQTGTQWAANTEYDEGVQLYPLSEPTGFYYFCSTQGVSGATEPVWPTTVNQTVNDGTCTWTCGGPVTPNDDLIV